MVVLSLPLSLFLCTDAVFEIGEFDASLAQIGSIRKMGFRSGGGVAAAAPPHARLHVTSTCRVRCKFLSSSPFFFFFFFISFSHIFCCGRRLGPRNRSNKGYPMLLRLYCSVLTYGGAIVNKVGCSAILQFTPQLTNGGSHVFVGPIIRPSFVT